MLTMKLWVKLPPAREKMNTDPYENGVPIERSYHVARTKCLYRRQMRAAVLRFSETRYRAGAQALGSPARRLGGRNSTLLPFAVERLRVPEEIAPNDASGTMVAERAENHRRLSGRGGRSPLTTSFAWSRIRHENHS
jgi:hypothetical protein